MPVATFAMHRTDLPNLMVRYVFIYSGYKKDREKKEKRQDQHANPKSFKGRGIPECKPEFLSLRKLILHGRLQD